MKVLITGADGFIAKNLRTHLNERKDVEVMLFTRTNTSVELVEMLNQVDFIFHLSGVNRTTIDNEYMQGNRDVTLLLCEALMAIDKNIPIIFTSSTQATLSNVYGLSKLAAEDVLRDFSHRKGAQVYIYRLPNVFGKWSRPNYNSAVATFCYNISRDLPITIHDADAIVSLVYVDDIVSNFIKVMDCPHSCNFSFGIVEPIYQITIGELASKIYAFRESRNTLITEDVGSGFARKLYATYVSYFASENFYYPLEPNVDSRGVFVEILKTKNSGQFSFFTAYPGITRGGHYHHSKTEKFLVITGNARFGFRHLISNEYYEINTSGEKPVIVETVPGWVHDITNIGQTEMIVMLWANEIFDRSCPDTYVHLV